ncbi:MAG: 4Fe-4S dicluster domain-containing protein, partial [Flavobacteriaceae bacterium]
GVFNPGKIVDPYLMDESLRYEADREEPRIDTLMDFSEDQGILRAAEKCNGSGDCRKTHLTNGAMCPSYQATRQEKDTTRARANALREVLTNSSDPNRFDSEDLKEVFDLCLSCKACASECPSNVDAATLKAEFQYQYQQANGYSWRNRLFAHNVKLNRWASKWPLLANAIFESKFLGGLLKKAMGMASQRSIPKVSSINLYKYLNSAKNKLVTSDKNVILFIDEFSQYWDTDVAMDAIDLLCGLGYDLKLVSGESGRAYISKGFLKQARRLAIINIEKLYSFASMGIPILGLEPSAILSFRDEYKKFHLEKNKVDKIAEMSLLIEEFLAMEADKGIVMPDKFTKATKEVKIHAHCHQKALSNQKVTFDMLNLPENYSVSIINSGCCGMAGSFGYEEEHYDISMKIGDLSLFPAIRRSTEEVIVAANGTSCRHQIKDGTGRIAKHPVSILKDALIFD